MPATALPLPTAAPVQQIFAFDDYELDTRRFELRRCDEAVPLEPQVFDVLAYLVQHSDRVVSKDELLDHVWPERYVSEAALNSRVMAARKAIGDSGQEQRYIRTIHGRGYRFIGSAGPGQPSLRLLGSDDAGNPLDLPSGAPTAATPPVRYARTRDGVSIAYSVTGEGPPLVRVLGWFTHIGLESRWDTLRHFYDSLSANHTLVRFDGRGMGLSQPADDFSLETRLADLEAVIEHAGLDRFALLGMCEGADTALHYAVRHPERVTRIITYGAGPSGPNPDDMQWTQLWQGMLQNVTDGWAHPSPVFRQLFAHVFLGASADPRLVERFDEIQRESVSGPRAYRYLSSLNEDGLDETAARVRVPTLVVHRRNDPIVPLSHSLRLAALIPDARLVALEGEARWLMVDQSVISEFVEVVESFTGARSAGDF